MGKGRLRLIHTSDWHIGHQLYERKRDEEFEFFFSWLAETIRTRDVGCLLVAGDVFDASSPSGRAQELYYRHLQKFRASGCRHIVITAGNHDPALLLDAPKRLLRGMDIHVIGEPDPENETIILRGEDGEPELAVCAAPFLREKYIRKSAPGESVEMKEAKLAEGIFEHYAALARHARLARKTFGVPAVAMGHLFAGRKGRVAQGDSERNLYVGALAQIGCEAFDEVFDYVALGHLHAPQAADEAGRIRYSGSPLAMSFGEAGRRKSVCLVEFAGGATAVELIPIPVYRRIARIAGDWSAIEKKFKELAAREGEPAPWIEVVYEGEDDPGPLREKAEELGAACGAEILGARDMRLRASLLSPRLKGEELSDLTPRAVFERCLAARETPEERRPALLRAFDEVCALLEEEERD